MSKHAYTFRLYPTCKQRECLQWRLDRARELYNAALQERRDAYRMAGQSITYYDQANQLPEIKDIREAYQEIHSQVLQDVLRKVDQAFKMFFARCKRGDAPGFPRYYRKAEQRLAHLQQVLSRKKWGSHRRRKAVKQVAKAHRKVAKQQRDFLHKQSRKLVNQYGLIVFEELRPANMRPRPRPKPDENGTYLPKGAAAKGGLNKSIVDAGWGMFHQFCVYTAANAGRQVLFVNPRYTSQVCSGCGQVRTKDLSERWHSCACGTELDRDHNVAINILRLGRSRQASA